MQTTLSMLSLKMVNGIMTEYKNEVEMQRRLLILEKKQNEVEDIYIDTCGDNDLKRITYWNGKVEENDVEVVKPLSVGNQWRKYLQEKQEWVGSN